MHADQFPITVQDLDLRKMGIQELSDSLETLRNLKRLSLGVNPFKSLKFVKLPVLSLGALYLNACSFHLISPLLVSMLEEKNKTAKLAVVAFGNRNLNAADVKRTLEEMDENRFSIHIDYNDATLTEMSKSFPNLYCWDAESSSYFKEFGFRKSQVVVPICYTDVYNEIKNSIDEDYVYQVFKRRKYW